MYGVLNIEYIYINLFLKFFFVEFIIFINFILLICSIINREKELKYWYMYIYFVILYLRVMEN